MDELRVAPRRRWRLLLSLAALAAVSLLAENPRPTEEQVRTGLEGNLCRCTGYHNIVRAALAAAETVEVSS